MQTSAQKFLLYFKDTSHEDICHKNLLSWTVRLQV